MAFEIDLSGSAEPISRQVTRAIRQAIVTMQIAPGQMLSEHDISKKLGVSRQPVREAFIKLAESGLMRVLPQRGTLVVKISTAAVEDARFIREAVECAIAREAAGRTNKQSAAILADSLARQRRALRAKDGAALFALDEEFHRLLAEVAGRPSAWRVVEEAKPQMDRVRYLDMADAIPMSVVIAQHSSITDAVCAGDPDAAEQAMQAHLTEILRSLPKLALRYPDLFEETVSPNAALLQREGVE
jgi:DNA-binding GntR family transcriptional regulator